MGSIPSQLRMSRGGGTRLRFREKEIRKALRPTLSHEYRGGGIASGVKTP